MAAAPAPPADLPRHDPAPPAPAAVAAGPEPAAAAATPPAAARAATPPAAAADRRAEPAAERAAPAEPPRHPAPRFDPPRFDVVRVGMRGMAVVAGRAAPGAEVILYDGPRELGRARADTRGEWVILPPDPIGGGARELSLRARLPGGDEQAGPDTVLVVGPAPAEPPIAVAEAAPRPAERHAGESGRAPASARPAAPRLGEAAPADRTGASPAAPANEPRPARATEGAPSTRAGASTTTAGPSPTANPETGPAAPEASAAMRPAAQVTEAHPAPAPAAEPPTGPLVLLLPPTASGAPRRLGGAAQAAQAAPAPQPAAPAAAQASGARPAPQPAPAAEPPFTLGLDVVDYDDSNTMRFAGTAPPGAQLRLYADDRHLGDTQADATGRWSLAPTEPPAVGRHTLRVDQLAEPAPPARPPVQGRIEVAFQRESLPAGAVRDGQVVVQPGNNLWRIARAAYGQGTRYTVIYRANQAQIRNPSRIFPGQIFAVPDAADPPAR
ncbi:LysM peptidoglycan-binding domain-containing protein [Muricoccus radiodurans]|uniref:LysM peptidoglycan-binding domain-containing protein n=1 Tax=Muricoccus radiodurans TaxID=2231721 RepID=UPI003CEC91B0